MNKPASLGLVRGSGEPPPCGEQQLCCDCGEAGSDSLAAMAVIDGFGYTAEFWLFLLAMAAICCEFIVNSREGRELMDGWRGELGEDCADDGSARRACRLMARCWGEGRRWAMELWPMLVGL